MAQNYNLTQTGEQVQGLLNQVTPNTQDIVVLKEGVAARPTTEQVAQMVVTALQNYSTTAEMQQAITDAVVSALSDYSTTTEMNTAITAAITSALANYSTTAQMNTAIATAVAQALVNYYTKSETDAKVSAEAGRAQSVEGNLQQLIISVQQSLVNYYLKTETYSKTEVNALVAAIKQFQYQVVATLPETPGPDTMYIVYLVPSTDPKTQNVKDEFITVLEGSTYKWEQIGSTAVDLSGYSTTAEMNAAIAQALTAYYTKAQVDSALAGKQNVLTFDNTPTAGSMNPVTSGGVKGAIDTESARAAAAEQGLQDEYDSLYALYEAASFGEVVPVAYNDWPLATLEEGKVYRVANSATPTAYSDYMYDGTNTILLATFSFPGIDNVPTAGSSNLVTSGGVQNELALGAVYDVSAKNPTAGPNNNGKWESLSALLSDANLNTLIPTAVRKGGMSIKFVCSSDNEYVQYRLTNKDWSTVVADWQGVDDEPTAGSENLVKSGGVAAELYGDLILQNAKEVSYTDNLPPAGDTAYLTAINTTPNQLTVYYGAFYSNGTFNRSSAVLPANSKTNLELSIATGKVLSYIRLDYDDFSGTVEVLWLYGKTGNLTSLIDENAYNIDTLSKLFNGTVGQTVPTTDVLSKSSYFNLVSGNLVEHTGETAWRSSDYLKITDTNVIVKIRVDSLDKPFVAFFDENYDYISGVYPESVSGRNGIRTINSVDLTIPSGAVYYRVQSLYSMVSSSLCNLYDIPREKETIVDGASVHVVKVGETGVSSLINTALQNYKNIKVVSDGDILLDSPILMNNNNSIEFDRFAVIKTNGAQTLICNRSVYENPSADCATTTNISVKGGIWDGTNTTTIMAGFYGTIVFLNCVNLEIKDVILRNCPRFAMEINTCDKLILENITFEGNIASDSIHLGGNIKDFVISGIYGYSGDDMIALNAWDWGMSSPKYGTIQNGIVKDVYCVSAASRAINILAAKNSDTGVIHTVKDIVISNVHAIAKTNALCINYQADPYGTTQGNYEATKVSNITVDSSVLQKDGEQASGTPTLFIACDVENLRLSNTNIFIGQRFVYVPHFLIDGEWDVVVDIDHCIFEGFQTSVKAVNGCNVSAKSSFNKYKANDYALMVGTENDNNAAGNVLFTSLMDDYTVACNEPECWVVH